jgi:hypothetical protein
VAFRSDDETMSLSMNSTLSLSSPRVGDRRLEAHRSGNSQSAIHPLSIVRSRICSTPWVCPPANATYSSPKKVSGEKANMHRAIADNNGNRKSGAARKAKTRRRQHKPKISEDKAQKQERSRIRMESRARRRPKSEETAGGAE